jgi:HK97 family phage portal protein
VSLFRRQRREAVSNVSGIPPRNPSKTGSVYVTSDSAMRHSAVWACLRLRNDLISTMPVDVFRRIEGRQVELPTPPVFVEPGGVHVDWCEFMYSSGVDLDRAGNTIGLITEVNGLGLPARIDLKSLSECTVLRDKGELKYRIEGKVYPPEKVWHEKQFTMAGLDVGLSPVAYAAWSIGEYLSIQQFALDWFGGGAVPKARLRNNAKVVSPDEANKIKERYRASVSNGDLFVTGSDWEYDMIQAQAQDRSWIEGKRAGISDVARFFGCPGDLIDAAVATGSITYANITQRNLQLLITNLGPAIVRRERTFSRRLLPRPRFVKLNSDALLRMDPETRERVIRSKVESRRMTPSEARELDNLPPFTDAQLAEFDRVYGAPRVAPTPAERAMLDFGPWDQVNPLSAAPYVRPEVG